MTPTPPVAPDAHAWARYAADGTLFDVTCHFFDAARWPSTGAGRRSVRLVPETSTASETQGASFAVVAYTTENLKRITRDVLRSLKRSGWPMKHLSPTEHNHRDVDLAVRAALAPFVPTLPVPMERSR